MKLGIELGIYQPKTCISIFFFFFLIVEHSLCSLMTISIFPEGLEAWKTPGSWLMKLCYSVQFPQSLLKQRQILPFTIHVIVFQALTLSIESCLPPLHVSSSLSYSMSPQFMKCVLYTWRLTAESRPISLVARTVDCDLLISRKSHLLGWTLGCKFVP